MNRPYKLEHPLYPHPKALEYCKKHNMDYEPHDGAFDTRYEQWFNACRVDIEEGYADERELFHYVTSVYRIRTPNGEKLYYKEYIVGYDKDQIPQVFDHYEGMYEVKEIDRFFNYKIGKPDKRFKGETIKEYYIDYTPEKVLDLAELAPTNKQQYYYIITQGNQKKTHDVFFNKITFAYMDFEDLNEIATSPILSDALRNKIKTIEKEYKEKVNELTQKVRQK